MEEQQREGALKRQKRALGTAELDLNVGPTSFPEKGTL